MRRRVSSHILLFALWVISTIAGADSGGTAADWPALPIADGDYVFAGAVEPATAANRGRVGNVGVIIGDQGVVVIGTGSSEADGERLIESIGRLTSRPIVLAIDAYAAPEHVLGNSAFARRNIPILAHRATAHYMALNCDACQRSVAAEVGDTTRVTTSPSEPKRLIDGPMTLVAGGRRLDILYYGTTQQAGSIAVFDSASGVLFAGGLASFDLVPDIRDADVAAWLKALADMRSLPLKRVVPGQGPVGEPRRLDEFARYLRSLAEATQRAYDGDLGLAEATRSVQLPNFETWALYARNHPRNVHFQYLQIEARELGAAPNTADAVTPTEKPPRTDADVRQPLRKQPAQ
jgi:glyoxylase-like metal-dependent hydrolase (beta-lactamase superfamily II)